jgi:hypothetical protein
MVAGGAACSGDGAVLVVGDKVGVSPRPGGLGCGAVSGAGVARGEELMLDGRLCRLDGSGVLPPGVSAPKISSRLGLGLRLGWSMVVLEFSSCGMFVLAMKLPVALQW